MGQPQNQPSRAEGLANKVAGWLFYIAAIVSAIAFIIWLMIADLEIAIRYTVTTLVIACPHALGLAIPLVVARSTSLGAGRGLLVKDREALELASKADVGMAVGAGTQVAIDSADIILTQSDPGDIESFLELSKKTTCHFQQSS